MLQGCRYTQADPADEDSPYLALSAHKLGGPKGVGAFVVDEALLEVGTVADVTELGM